MGLLNKERNNFIQNHKIFKYTVYALGEVLIVTIGIFIAIQLNNWNENRKTTNKVKGILKEIQTDLSYNRKQLQPVILWYKQRDSLIQLVKSKSLTVADYQKNPELLTLINFYNAKEIVKTGYLKLKDHIDAVPKEYEDVLADLNILYNQMVPMAERYAIVMESFNHRMHERWALKYLWFSEPRDVTNIEARIHHFLTSEEYQNDVRLYSMYSKDNYVAGLQYIDQFSEKVLKQLNDLDAKNSDIN